MYKVRVKPISNAKVLEVSNGEVYNDLMINLKTRKPVRDGLFCQKIFGPIKSYTCECGKYSGASHYKQVCDNCEVEILPISERNNRFGHITLTYPVMSPIYQRFYHNIFGISTTHLNDFMLSMYEVYFKVHNSGSFTTINGSKVIFKAKRINEESTLEASGFVSLGRGPYGLHKFIEMIDFDASITNSTGRINHELTKLKNNDLVLSDLMIKHLPVIPPTYRKISFINDQVMGTSLNELYARIIRVCDRFTRVDTTVSDIFYGEYSLLQKAICNLLVNGSKLRRASGKEAPLDSVFSRLTGKGGRLRGSLLGKRVDYSGRSVISSAPEISIDELMIPMEMAMELFKPFAIRYLLKNELVNNYREAVMAYENESGIYKIAIKNVAKERLVMMNRAPTLHRYGVMAFKPVLHSGRYIGVHPLVCDPFGADFDGDTVCIMVPLQNKALTEARDILMPSCNLISQATGDILMNFSHEALSGLYHMTDIKGDSGVTASSIGEIIHLYHIGVLSVNTGVTLRTGSESVLTCAGRAMIEEVTKVPVTAGYSKGYSKKYLKEIFLSNTRENSVKIIDVMTKWAFEYSTKMGLSVCYEDCYYEVDRKDSFFDKGYEYEKEVNGNDNFDDSRKHELIIRNWVGLIDEMKHDFIKQNPDNSLVVMMKSGSRLSDVQFLQISVTKGIFSNAKGETSKTPIKNSYYEGLTGLEYFSTCSSAHKAMADKKLVTPKAGYMTRQLVNSNKEMLIVEEDCGSTDYVWTDKLGLNNREIMETGEGMYLGKYLVRSPITCKSVRGGICVKCYGGDPNTQKPIRINERVGIIAAHSVSESGTQLSMKSKHTAGAVESVDKDQMLTAPEDGVVKIESQEHHYELFINDKKYVMLKMNSNILVSDGDKVKCGQAIAELTEENIKTSSGEIVKLANLFNLYRSDYCITSFSQGEVSFIVDRSSISVLVGGVLQDKTSSMILAHEGQMMNIGDRLTVGAFNPRKFFDKTKDVKLTGQLWVDNMFDIYKYFGKSLRKIHFETIYRSMTDIVMIDKETRGLKSRGQHGDQLLLGAIQSVRAYPSWLKSISLGWAYDRMTKAVYNMESSVNCETEQVIMGTTVNSVLTHDSEGRL